MLGMSLEYLIQIFYEAISFFFFFMGWFGLLKNLDLSRKMNSYENVLIELRSQENMILLRLLLLYRCKEKEYREVKNFFKNIFHIPIKFLYLHKT